MKFPSLYHIYFYSRRTWIYKKCEIYAGFFTNPFFTFIKVENATVMDGASYLALLFVINILCTKGISQFFSDSGIRISFNNLILSGLLTILFPIVIGILINIGLYYEGGKRGFRNTIKICVFSMAPLLLLGWIPRIGLIIGSIGFILLVIVGLRVYEGFSGKKILWVLFKLIVLIILVIILIKLFMGGAGMMLNTLSLSKRYGF